MSIYPPTGTLEIKNATLKIPVVDLQYTSNTAKLEANSNVVTEFSRSKKLIKYPRVAMTGPSAPTGYVASASTSHSSGSYSAYKAFDSKYEFTTSSGWASDGSAFSSQVPSGSASSFNNDSGEYLTIQLPNKIKLETHHLFGRQDIRTNEFPVSAKLYASNDNFTKFELIESYEDLAQPTSSTEAQVHNINETRYFQYYRLMITKTSGAQTYAAVGEWELYGVPEYDPEAHGTDVTVKSYPNVPNTDWLEVYYDGQDYTQTSDFTGAGGVIDKAGGDQDGTAGTGVGFDTTYKAFTFDGSTTGKITGTHGLGTGTGITPTISLWFRMNDTATNRFFVIGDQGTNYRSMTVGHHQGFVYLDYWYSEVQTPSTAVVPGVWYHLVIAHKGPGTTATGSQDIYLNNVKQTLNLHASNNTNSTFDLLGNGLVIGSNPDNTTQLNGSIANFRIFNRALTSDEIYQLYAYQKEDFGHGDLSMTLKAGRLGIGTSEPRAALDVRGDVKFSGMPNMTESIFFYIGGSAGDNYPNYQNTHEFYQNRFIPPDIGSYSVDLQWYTTSKYTSSSNDLFKSHFDTMVYWLKNAPIGHVHKLNWVTNGNSCHGTTFGQKNNGTQIRLWGYFPAYNTGYNYGENKPWNIGLIFNMSSATELSIFYDGYTISN